jgi:RNA polymerase sigma-70 factor (ECF subfamily)
VPIANVAPVRDDAEQYLEAALAGNRDARAALLRSLAPIVQVRVYRALAVRGGAARGRTLQQEMEDLTQDALVALLENDFRVLRAWDDARGLSLVNYVGLVTERLVGHRLRDRVRGPRGAEPMEDATLERAVGASGGHEDRVASREVLDRVWAALKRELTPRGWELFRWLVVEEHSVEDVCAKFAMRPDALYAWRSRFLKRARALLAEIEGPASDSVPITARSAVEETS